MGEVVLLVGHGSRDSEGKREFADLVAQVRALVPERRIEVGVLEFADSTMPRVDDAIDRCAQLGATELRIVPVLLHTAMHAQTDVPALVERGAARHPGLSMRVAPPLTAETMLLDIVEERIRASEASSKPPSHDATTVLLVGRGSNHPAANAEFFRTGRLLAERMGRQVECGFVSLASPDVPTALERCLRLEAQRVVVAPYFVNTGILVKRIAAQVAAFGADHPGLELIVTPHLGVHAGLVQLLRERVLDGAGTSALASAEPMHCPPPPSDPSSLDFPLLARYGLPPAEIEELSQRRITELIPNGAADDAPWAITRRMVYAAGDPALAPLVRIHPQAVDTAVATLRAGEPVLTDVQMVDVALERRRLVQLGVQTRCAILATRTARAAPRPGMTRAAAGMIALADGLVGGIVVVGNAPTALLALLDLVDAGRARPAVIIGTPVGFVAAAEAKAELAARATPLITVEGSRGGSAIAAAAANALLRLACPTLSEARP